MINLFEELYHVSVRESFDEEEFKHIFPDVKVVSWEGRTTYPEPNFSFVSNKNEIFWLPDIFAGHDTIIEHFKLREESARGYNLVRAILYPPIKDLNQPIKEWEFMVDGDEFPEWIDPYQTQKRGMEALPRYIEQTKKLQPEEYVKYSGVRK